MQPSHVPTFLPLTVAITREARPATADAVQRRAEEANITAAACWSALLGGCQTSERRALPALLRALADAASTYAGSGWWAAHGQEHQRRVAEAQRRISDAVLDGDGAEFAEAFIGYDQAIATAVASVDRTLESPTP